MSDSKKPIDARIIEIIGILLFSTGTVMLLSHIGVGGLHFSMWGNVNSAPVLVIALGLLVVIAILLQRAWPWILVLADITAIIVSVILGTQFYFKNMNALTLVVMVVIYAAGIGCLLAAVIKKTFSKKNG